MNLFQDFVESFLSCMICSKYLFIWVIDRKLWICRSIKGFCVMIDEVHGERINVTLWTKDQHDSIFHYMVELYNLALKMKLPYATYSNKG